MASLAARQTRPRGPHLFEGPVFLRRTRNDIVELVGWVWLAVEIAGWLRSRLEKRASRRP
jgi:hypothetical protein